MDELVKKIKQDKLKRKIEHEDAEKFADTLKLLSNRLAEPNLGGGDDDGSDDSTLDKEADDYYYSGGEEGSGTSFSTSTLKKKSKGGEKKSNVRRRKLQGGSGRFGIFKAYDKERVRPPQYAKVSRRHAIEEYLTPVQKMMKRKRESKSIDKEDTFSGSWSGFDKLEG